MAEDYTRTTTNEESLDETTSKEIEASLNVIHEDDVPTMRNQQDDPPPYTEQDRLVPEDTENYFDTSQSPNINEDDEITDAANNITDDDENLLMGKNLSPLEKLVKFSNSSLVLQRLLITRDLFTTIQSISLEDAVYIALPIITQLGKDPEDSVREGIASELDRIIYFYYENAPPLLLHENEVTLHIPNHIFVVTIIEFLLDQNTTLATMAQQSIVAVADELAQTPPEDERYHLHQALLNQEIFQGVVCGLISIFSEDQQDNNKTVNSSNGNKESSGSTENQQFIEKDSTTVLEKIATSDVEITAKLACAIATTTNTILKTYDNGGINLAKMVCLMLVSALSHAFGPEGCKEKILPIVESMVADPMFYVRKEAAAAVGSLCTVLTPDVTLQRLLPLYRKLSVDTIWHVRRACVFALPYLADVLDTHMKFAIIIEGVELFKNDVSRNVRNSLADIIGELISKFLPVDWKETGNCGLVPDSLLEFFLSLGDINKAGTNQMFKLDIERIYNCAYNFPVVVLTAGVTYWDQRLKDTYLNLTKDYQLKVRRTFAYSLHEIARIIGPERTERDLVQIFALYLMDMDDVKQGVLEHLSEFLSVLTVRSRNDYIPILAEVWDGVMSNWHLRDILTVELKDIARLFDAARVVEHILPLALRACHDEFAAVRASGVEIFPVILDIVKRTVDVNGEDLLQVDVEDKSDESDDLFERQQNFALALLNHVMEKLDELVKSPAYRIRLAFTHICQSLLEQGMHAADFASFFLPKLVMLAKDPIVNIRIATSRTIHVLCSIHGYRQDLEAISSSEEVSMGDELNPGQALDEIFYYLSMDIDQDVRYFVGEFVSSEKLEAYQRRRDIEALEIVQHGKPPPPPTHSSLPDKVEQDLVSLRDDDETMESPGVTDSLMEEKNDMV